ncbi:MAG: tellurite resistance TerB family protein [Lysobacterales bacterium]
MFDPERLLGQLVGQALGAGRRGRSRRHSAIASGSLGSKAALGLGALGIAIAAYEHYQQRSSTGGVTPGSAAPAPSGRLPPPPPPQAKAAHTPPPPPAATAQSAADARLLVQCMIAAAAADGSIDSDERARILERMRGLGLDEAGEAFLTNELAAPKSADDIGAATRPGLVEAVYTAALLGIDPDHPAETAFLDRLAGALGLDATARQALGQQLSGPTEQP